MKLAVRYLRLNADLSARRRPCRSLAVEVKTLESRSLLSVIAGGTATPPPPGVLEQRPDGTQGYDQWGQPFRDPSQLVGHNRVLK